MKREKERERNTLGLHIVEAEAEAEAEEKKRERKSPSGRTRFHHKRNARGERETPKYGDDGDLFFHFLVFMVAAAAQGRAHVDTLSPSPSLSSLSRLFYSV